MKQKKSTIRFLKKSAKTEKAASHKPSIKSKTGTKKSKVRFSSEKEEDLIAEQTQPLIIKHKNPAQKRVVESKATKRSSSKE